ncbi:MAG: YIP1 family protein [Candidatus Poribacteria bacterium]|nr:YIP1 family protein [Candidatus Poribacteria bacterium]
MKPKLQVIGNIFDAPIEAFTALKARPSWLTGFIVIVVASIGLAWLMLPFLEEQARIEMAKFGIGLADIQHGQAIARNFIFLTPVLLLLKWLIFAGIFYFGARWLGGPKGLTFKPVYAAVAHTEFILVFANLLNVALVLSLKEVGEIKDVTDLYMIPSLHLIFGDAPVGIPYFTFLRQINPFSVWYLFVLSRGVAVVTEISRRRAEWFVALVWLAGVGVEVAIAAF